MKRLLLTVVLTVTGVAVLPSVASADTLVNFGPNPSGGNILNVNDVDGTSQNLRVGFTNNGQVKITDPNGVTTNSIPPCTQVNATEVRCPGGGALIIKVQLGIGDDVLVIDEFLIQGMLVDLLVFLGAGDDTYEGCDCDDEVHGEDGDDDMDGDSGNDKMLGGKGRDREEGGLGNDWMYGGAHNDFLFGQNGRDWLFGGKGRGDKCNGGKMKDWNKGCEIGVNYSSPLLNLD